MIDAFREGFVGAIRLWVATVTWPIRWLRVRLVRDGGE